MRNDEPVLMHDKAAKRIVDHVAKSKPYSIAHIDIIACCIDAKRVQEICRAEDSKDNVEEDHDESPSELFFVRADESFCKR